MIATMKANPIPHRETYNQDDATGFIRLNALRLKVSCDSIGVFVRSEVLGQSEKGYIQALFGIILQSPEFKPVKVKVVEVPETESGQKFVDQFLGMTILRQKLVFPLSVEVPFKKARIMMHWATRVGAQVQRDPT